MSSSYYVPVADYYAVEPSYAVVGPPEVTQTYVNPVPRVSEVEVNELLPFQATPSYTVNNWVVRSNVADRGALANSMLMVWRPEDLDYGSDVDTTSIPQVYLFTNDKERQRLQKRLYTDYPELNLQSYALKVPVRISTHRYPGASFVQRESVVIPGIYPPIVAQSEPITFPPEIYGQETLSSRAVALPPLVGPPRKKPTSRKTSRKSASRRSAKK